MDGVCTNDLSKLEVRLRKHIGPISELTTKGVFLSAVQSLKLSGDHSKGPVMREHFALPVQAILEGGYRQRPCQGWQSV